MSDEEEPHLSSSKRLHMQELLNREKRNEARPENEELIVSEDTKPTSPTHDPLPQLLSVEGSALYCVNLDNPPFLPNLHTEIFPGGQELVPCEVQSSQS